MSIPHMHNACNITNTCPATNNMWHNTTSKQHMPKRNCQPHFASHRSTASTTDKPLFTTMWGTPNLNAVYYARIENPMCTSCLSIIRRLLQVSTCATFMTELLEGGLSGGELNGPEFPRLGGGLGGLGRSMFCVFVIRQTIDSTAFGAGDLQVSTM